MAKLVSEYAIPIEAVPENLPTPIRSLYSQQIYAYPIPGDAAYPREITIDRQWSGIKLEWSTDDLAFPEIKIVRKKRDFSYSTYDGITVYEGDAFVGEYVDATAYGIDTYYYTFWFRVDPSEPWTTRYWTRASEVSLGTGNLEKMQTRLWTLLPMMYRQNEEERDNSEDMNLHVNRVIAPVVREIEDLTEFFPTHLDVDQCPGKNLKSIAKYVGLEPNLELTYTQQREEIKGAVESFKRKGLVATLERMAQAISGVPSSVVDWNQNLLIRNWPGKTKLTIDPVAGFNQLLPGDTAHRKLDITGGKQFDTATYGVYLEMSNDKPVSERSVRKLYRSLGGFAPVYMEMDLQLIGPNNVEQFDEITETSWVEVEDDHTEDLSPQNLLMKNTLGSTKNTLGLTKLENWPEDEGAEEVS